MKIKTALLVLASAVAVTAAVRYAPQAPARADGLPDLLELAPRDSTFILYADLAALRNSPLVQRLEAMAPAATTDQDYAEFVRSTGFDYQKDLDRVMLTSEHGVTVAFADGRFDRAKIEQYAQHSGKLDHQDGRPVYRLPATTPGKTLSLAFLGNNRIVLADGGDLAAELSGTPAPLDAAMRERLSRVAAAPLFAVANAAANTTAAQPPQGPLRSLHWVSFAARPDGSDVYLSAEGECDTADQAQSVASGAQLLRVLIHGGLADPKARGKMSADQAAAINRLLDAVGVTTEGSRVRLLLTVSPDMLPLASPASTPPATH